MSKSKKSRHFMDEGGQLGIMRSIRKPMPKPSRVINPKDDDEHFDWREAMSDWEEENKDDEHTP